MKPCHQRLKRGIAGGLVWINFDRHALMALFNKARGKFVADVDEIRPQYQDSNLSDGAAIFNSSLIRSVGPSIGATIDQLDALTLTEVGSLNELATPWLPTRPTDQVFSSVLPFRHLPLSLPLAPTPSSATLLKSATYKHHTLADFERAPDCTENRAEKHGNCATLNPDLSSGVRQRGVRQKGGLAKEVKKNPRRS